ncbi:HAD family hydrolase [Desulfoluna butyratoxydans]|uniref:Haloacid dehalogenase-like hydrolase n=1 Tax=Desulfoluna butyratoxydans TaxID=231438 RepID=A0A4U8YHX9_9BACT|nr:HAD family hydrolase [Desulfoluna butyratoxydans]VFQ42804.1 haloacid dehalogenase-like hydrolase [Desulfoluna butyratoxydans]
MNLIMFDIDGTLIQSCGFDAECYLQAVKKVTGVELNTDWTQYTHITDAGILDEFLTMEGLHENRATLHRQVREEFTHLVASHLKSSPVREVDGAVDFLDLLRTRDDVEIALATGGWEETAKAKLRSAGFDPSDVAFASCSDHVERTRVMQTAESRCRHSEFTTRTYFGDGPWDKEASRKLDYQFILVGNGLCHTKQVDHFRDAESVLSLIGI